MVVRSKTPLCSLELCHESVGPLCRWRFFGEPWLRWQEKEPRFVELAAVEAIQLISAINLQQCYPQLLVHLDM